jgi:hypothetical protein
VSEIVYAAAKYADNAAMIEALARLGHLTDNAETLDLTYGNGAWWKRWAPLDVFAPLGVDFRATPFAPRSFEQIAFDPPYVSVGGRETSGIKAMLDRYGLDEAPTSPADLQRTLINPGLDELRRLAPRVAVVKCMDYISSGALWLGSHYTMAKALRVGFTVLDKIERVGSGGPQPGDRTRKCPACHSVAIVVDGCVRCDGEGRIATRQQHARRNITTMWVLTLSKRQRLENPPWHPA